VKIIIFAWNTKNNKSIRQIISWGQAGGQRGGNGQETRMLAVSNLTKL